MNEAGRKEPGTAGEAMLMADVVTLPPLKQEGQKSKGSDFGARRTVTTSSMWDAWVLSLSP